ncbi:conserved protein, unknown function [Hepatocystis sp. ex Piliocolobus tephrosceles]|nr:conserved protein, unknown function [Hepatocystis sp. ex Piliocolobus tephrosceles]
MKTPICTGPYISDNETCYNVQINGISLNFLKKPFLFKNNITEVTNNERSNFKSKQITLGQIEKYNSCNNLNILEVPSYYIEKDIKKSDSTILYKNNTINSFNSCVYMK